MTSAQRDPGPLSGERSAERGAVRELLRAIPVFAGDPPGFDPEAAPGDPVRLFAEWLATAIAGRVPEPHAMTLSTADQQGRPSSRVLVCRDVDAGGCWYFGSLAASRKGRELRARPDAALTFYWPQQGRQIRVRGTAARAGAGAGAADFLVRSPQARAEALTGRQSEVLADPAEAEVALEEARARIAAAPDLVAPGWTLYALSADEVEFWQADEQRRHTRLLYRRTVCQGRGRAWTRVRLWP